MPGDSSDAASHLQVELYVDDFCGPCVDYNGQPYESYFSSTCLASKWYREGEYWFQWGGTHKVCEVKNSKKLDEALEDEIEAVPSIVFKWDKEIIRVLKGAVDYHTFENELASILDSYGYDISEKEKEEE